ncbi:MAG: nuclear transport factor 2 family protein [Chromatiales bacterium]|nr:nuclear transport factor 2 family protein [Chromatiales bacterium]
MGATVLLALLTGCASTRESPTNGLMAEQSIPMEPARNQSMLDAEITAFLARYADAYNREDYTTLLGMWDQDDPDAFYMAEEIDPPMHGWKTIRAYFSRGGVLDGIRNEYSNVRAHYVAPDVAVATYRLRFDIKVKNMQALSSFDRIMAVFRRKDGEWKMIAYAEAPQAPLTMIRKALKTSKSLDPAQQKELLRTVQTLLQDAVPEDFNAWLEQQQPLRAKP